MDLRAPLQLQTMMKAMKDVVLPAIDPSNQMAQEQAQLVMGMLHLMMSRQPMQFHYDLDELKRYVALSKQLLAETRGGPLTSAELESLLSLVTESEDLISRAQAAPSELESAVLDLRNKISRLVETLWQDGEQACREPASKAVLAASKEQIIRERAWFSPQGWDADTSQYPSIESLIDYPSESSESNI